LFELLILATIGVAKDKGPLHVGDMPPDKLGRTAGGEQVKLSNYRGKVVIVSFWATWCGPCRKELPVLAGIQKQATRDRLVAFAVNWKEDQERFRDVVRAMKSVDLNLVSDSQGYYGREYGVDAIPHMVIIGRDGRIAAIHIGYGESEIPVLVEEINKLLAAPTNSPTPAEQSPTTETETTPTS
jgi:thiol-disulfide isomerase/thioredoxin